MSDTANPEDHVQDDTGFIRRSISLYPTQDAAVTAFAKDSGLENWSAALRMIINQWLRYETEKAKAHSSNN